MNTLDKAVETQLETIQARLGMSLNDMAEMVKRTGLTRQGDIRWMLQREYGIKHDDAQMLVTALFENHAQESQQSYTGLMGGALK